MGLNSKLSSKLKQLRFMKRASKGDEEDGRRQEGDGRRQEGDGRRQEGDGRRQEGDGRRQEGDGPDRAVEAMLGKDTVRRWWWLMFGGGFASLEGCSDSVSVRDRVRYHLR